MVDVCVFNETELNNLIFIVSQRFGSGALPSSGDQKHVAEDKHCNGFLKRNNGFTSFLYTHSLSLL